MAEPRLFQDSTSGTPRTMGDTIFTAGDPGETLYVVQQGEVEILAGDELLDTLGPGEIFGEMALIDHEPRSASARAKTDCLLVELDEQRFLFSVQNNPLFALEVLRTLARRLRAKSPAR